MKERNVLIQARTLEWVAISFSNAWKWKVKVKSLNRVRPSATPWTAAFQAPPSMGFSRQEYWSGVPLPSLAKGDKYSYKRWILEVKKNKCPERESSKLETLPNSLLCPPQLFPGGREDHYAGNGEKNVCIWHKNNVWMTPWSIINIIHANY